MESMNSRYTVLHACMRVHSRRNETYDIYEQSVYICHTCIHADAFRSCYITIFTLALIKGSGLLPPPPGGKKARNGNSALHKDCASNR